MNVIKKKDPIPYGAGLFFFSGYNQSRNGGEILLQ